jgi:urea carboxylase
VGNKVTAGENLILLESMKMILPIKAPYDGVIESINCSPGEAVQPGVQLLNIEQIVD